MIPLTHAERGRLGGLATSARMGREYLAEMGRANGAKGGRPTWQESIEKANARAIKGGRV